MIAPPCDNLVGCYNWYNVNNVTYGSANIQEAEVKWLYMIVQHVYYVCTPVLKYVTLQEKQNIAYQVFFVCVCVTEVHQTCINNVADMTVRGWGRGWGHYNTTGNYLLGILSTTYVIQQYQYNQLSEETGA